MIVLAHLKGIHTVHNTKLIIAITSNWSGLPYLFLSLAAITSGGDLLSRGPNTLSISFCARSYAVWASDGGTVMP